MGDRAIRRARARREAKALRREAMLRRRAVLAAGATLGSLAVAPAAAQAATFVVSDLGDAGPGTLRQAIADADAAAGADTVTFASSLSGQIDLASQLVITSTVAIEGPGADRLTIDGGDATRLMYASPAAADTVTVTGLTLTGGSAVSGAAIRTSAGTLVVRDSVLTDNHASGSGGAIAVVAGALTISGTRIADNTAGNYGGGVHVDGRLNEPGDVTIADSTVSGNTSGTYGGGISLYDAYEDVRIAATTISGNTAQGGGGGVWFEDLYAGASAVVERSTVSSNTAAGAGGGISFGENFYGPTRLVGSTVVGNAARDGGGLHFADLQVGGSFGVLGSTVTGNVATRDGGGIFRGYDTGGGDAPVAVTSTVVAGNTASGAGPDVGQGTPTGDLTLGNSLLGDPAGATFVQTPNGNLLGVDPQLGPLADNGGPTRTRLPAATSPLLDAGLAGGETTDQRGLARTVDLPEVPPTLGSDGTDIGAVERQLPPSTPPPVVLSSGPVAGPAGTAVTIRGGSFATATTVLFGDTPATFVVDGDDQITAAAPGGLGGTVAIVVVTASGRSAPTAAGQFTYVAPAAPLAPPAPSGEQLACGRVPTLVGRTMRAARRLLDRDGCADVPLERDDRRRPRGRKIVAQHPAAGTPLSAGDRVTVTLSPRRKAKRERQDRGEGGRG